jgi:recombination protein RecA
MSPRALRLEELVSLLSEKETVPREQVWSLAAVAGRFVELTGVGASALLTAAFGLVLDAQRSGEPAAWITLPPSTFFPPDAAEGGVDLDSLAVVRTPDPSTAARAAIQLTRSGGFGLVVLDFGAAQSDGRSSNARDISLPLQTRLVGMAQKHDTAVVVLSEKPAEAPSLGSLVSLRVEAKRQEIDESPSARNQMQLRVLKDKRRGPGRVQEEICYGPPGLC